MSEDDYFSAKPFIEQELGGLVVQLSGRAPRSVRSIPDTKPKPIKSFCHLAHLPQQAFQLFWPSTALTRLRCIWPTQTIAEGYIVVPDKPCLEMAFQKDTQLCQINHAQKWHFCQVVVPFNPSWGEAKTGGSLCVIQGSLVYTTTPRRPTVTEKPCFNPHLKRKMTFQ